MEVKILFRIIMSLVFSGVGINIILVYSMIGDIKRSNKLTNKFSIEAIDSLNQIKTRDAQILTEDQIDFIDSLFESKNAIQDEIRVLSPQIDESIFKFNNTGKIAFVYDENVISPSKISSVSKLVNQVLEQNKLSDFKLNIAFDINSFDLFETLNDDIEGKIREEMRIVLRRDDIDYLLAVYRQQNQTVVTLMNKNNLSGLRTVVESGFLMNQASSSLLVFFTNFIVDFVNNFGGIPEESLNNVTFERSYDYYLD